MKRYSIFKNVITVFYFSFSMNGAFYSVSSSIFLSLLLTIPPHSLSLYSKKILLFISLSLHPILPCFTSFFLFHSIITNLREMIIHFEYFNGIRESCKKKRNVKNLMFVDNVCTLFKIPKTSHEIK